nr:hypothetical protein [Tanacetum cinerariifolium]
MSRFRRGRGCVKSSGERGSVNKKNFGEAGSGNNKNSGESTAVSKDLGEAASNSCKNHILDTGKRAVDVTRLKFRYPLYPCVLCDLCDALLPLLDIRCALTRKAFDAFCAKYPIPEERNSCAWLESAAITLLMRKLILGSCIRTERVDMDLFAFIHALDPTKVKIVKREQVEDEPLLLQTTVGRTVPLLPVAPDRVDSELKTSIDKLFDEGGSDVAPLQPRRQRKKKTVVAKAGGSSYPPKKLREDHGTPSGPPKAGKSTSAVQRLLAGAVLNAEVRGDHIPTLPFVTSFESATLEHEGEDHTDFVTGLNLRTISAPQRFVISSYSSRHSGANVAEAEVDSLDRSSIPVMTAVTTTTPTADHVVVVKEKTAKPSVFAADSSSAGGADPNASVFSDLIESEFLISGFRTVIDPDIDLQKVYMSLSAEVRMRVEYNVGDKRRLKSAIDEKDELLKVRDKKIKNLKAHMVLKGAEAVKAIHLRAEASNFVTVEKSLRDEVNALNGCNIILEKERNALDVTMADLEASSISKERGLTDLHAQLTFVKSHNDSLANQLKVVNEKFDKLYADFMEMTLHLEERFYPHLLTTIFGRRWLLTHGMELAISKCLNSSEYLFALGEAIDVATYNPSVEADYISALQRLQSVNFSLLAELRSYKDASIDILMVHIHHSSDKTVIGATSLSFTLDVSNVWVRKIRENITGQRSALYDVFIPLSEPFFVEVLTGTRGTSDTVPDTAVATTALSTTLASASTVDPISVDDCGYG